MHAIAGTPTPQTMRVKGALGRYTVIVLVDSGSTHNFLQEEVANKIGLLPDKLGQLDVRGASGEKLSSPRKCYGVQLRLQGIPIVADFYILQLEGYKVVVGAQWLQTLGPILWDFRKLQMQFSLEGKFVCLSSLSSPTHKFFNEISMQKESRRKTENYSSTTCPGRSTHFTKFL